MATEHEMYLKQVQDDAVAGTSARAGFIRRDRQFRYRVARWLDMSGSDYGCSPEVRAFEDKAELERNIHA